MLRVLDPKLRKSWWLPVISAEEGFCVDGCRGVPLNWRLKTYGLGLANDRQAAVASEKSMDLVEGSIFVVSEEGLRSRRTGLGYL